MKEVRQEVHVGDIDSGGGDVTVGPVVNNFLSGPQQEWRQALLRGPIAALGLESRLDRAYSKSAAGQKSEAALELSAIADDLDDAGYPAVADDVRLESAGLLRGQQPEEADERILEVARRQIDRADLHVEALLSYLADQALTLPPELTGVLRNIDRAVLPSRQEVELACKAAEGRGDESWWRARLTELAVLDEDPELALEVAEPSRSVSPNGADELLIQLDALAALETLEGSSAADVAWEPLLAWAEGAPRTPQERGLTFQRRGTALAYRDDLEGARSAYLQAARGWSEAPDLQEEAAVALFSSHRATFFLGNPAEREPLAVASNLRGPAQTSAAIGDRLTLAGLHRLVDEELRSGLVRVLKASRVAHRSGDLRGLIESFHILSRLWQQIAEASNKDSDRAGALHYAIRAGEHKRAKQLAGRGDVGALAPLLRLDGARWERAASYAAVARRGREIPEPEYSEIAGTILEEAELEPKTIFGNDVVRLARHAAAACMFVQDDEQRQRVTALMVETSREGMPEDREQALIALRQAQEAGLADHRELLLSDYLSNTPSLAVDLDSADELFADEVSQRTLREAALDGRVRALEALVVGDAADDQDLVALCEESVAAVLDVRTHEPGWLSWSHLCPDGLFGQVVDPDLRTQLAQKLSELATDATDSRANRMEALGAIAILAPALTDASAAAAFDAIAPSAAGDAPASAWDEDADDSRHPLEMLRRFEPQRDQHVAVAIRAAAALAGPASRLDALQEIVDSGLYATSDAVRRAAVAVLADHDSLRAPERLVQSDDPRTLASHLHLQIARYGMPAADDLAEVFSSPHFELRRVLLQWASCSPRDREVLERLARDRDGYLRAIARHRLLKASP